ncbi:MAG: DUF3298 domain-containing protein [Bacteroidales bacterium]|nr:DUF3298 domain-containing protein [Bacteroidales bacterium]
MKRIVLIALAAAAALVSCSRSQGLKTAVYEKSAIVALAEGATDSISIDVKLEYPVSGLSKEAMDAISRSILGQTLEYTGESPDFEAAVSRYIDATVADYKDTNLELWQESQENGEHYMGLTWGDELVGTFSEPHGNIVSYVLYSYSFQGGAHGNWGDYVTNFDMEDGSIVSEEDLFIPEYKEELSRLLTDHLYESMPDEDAYDGLFVKEIEPNGNFEVSEAGISYLYNPYEIGPYAIGLITVTVPWQELEHILK